MHERNVTGLKEYSCEKAITYLILASFATDFIITMAASVKSRWTTPIISDNLDWIFLQAPNQTFHQAKLNQLPAITCIKVKYLFYIAYFLTAQTGTNQQLNEPKQS